MTSDETMQKDYTIWGICEAYLRGDYDFVLKFGGELRLFIDGVPYVKKINDDGELEMIPEK